MTLRELLLAAQPFEPSYAARGLRLSNHLPMTLIALQRLGADDERLSAFFDGYCDRLEPVAVEGEFAQQRARYAEEIETHGAAPTLRTALPVLLPRLGAAAFHCTIRTAYAIEAELAPELASALAYWATTPFEAPEVVAGGTLGIGEALTAVRGNEALHFAVRHGTTIQSDMEAACALPAFAAAAQSVAPEQLTLRNLAEAALAIFLDSGDFTALHLVTGLHAARLLSVYADEGAMAQRLWPLLLAAYLTIERPVPRFDLVHAPAAPIGWPALFARAQKATDEHTVKLAYSAYSEWRIYGWPGYALAASRR